MEVCVRLEEKIQKPCCGIYMMKNISTLWIIMISLMLFVSHQIGIGFVLQLVHQLKFG
jgi:hypothetical protein